MGRMTSRLLGRAMTFAVLLGLGYALPTSWAFCGFYAAKADAKLYNKSSQVIMARHERRTVLTMANDYQGDVQEFALVVPVPLFVKDHFGAFYQAMFARAHERAGNQAVFTEYYGSFMKCDPCVIPPLEATVLIDAGVFWGNIDQFVGRDARWGMPYDASITRLHVRYTPEHFTEDLQFALQPADPLNIVQGRYVIRHPYYGWSLLFPPYWFALWQREMVTMTNLMQLTGWSRKEIANMR